MLYLLIDLVRVVATIYTVLIFIRVILSWVAPAHSHPLLVMVYRLTEPVLGPVRAILPAMGGLDFSPVVVLIGIQFVKQILIRLLFSMAGTGY